jgi:hypothetical protein
VEPFYVTAAGRLCEEPSVTTTNGRSVTGARRHDRTPGRQGRGAMARGLVADRAGHVRERASLVASFVALCPRRFVAVSSG